MNVTLEPPMRLRKMLGANEVQTTLGSSKQPCNTKLFVPTFRIFLSIAYLDHTELQKPFRFINLYTVHRFPETAVYTNVYRKMRITDRLLQHACRITLFTRENCGLCTQAKSVLSDVWDRRPFEYREVDIIKSQQIPRWRDLYEFDVPVVRTFDTYFAPQPTGH